jgi:malate dehydrogenase (oxaloacetate-decarboxylating)(NADP+)
MHHLGVISQLIGKRPGVNSLAAMNYLMLPGRSLFLCDTHINENPTSEEIVEMTLMAAEQVRRFGMHPKVALLSHSNFGSGNSESARKMSRAAALLAAMAPADIEVDGEMHGDSALSDEVRRAANPDSSLKGEANLLIMPNIDAANIAYNLIKMTSGDGVTIGPILLGAARPVHVLTSTATVRRLVNMAAMAVVESMAR